MKPHIYKYVNGENNASHISWWRCAGHVTVQYENLISSYEVCMMGVSPKDAYNQWLFKKDSLEKEYPVTNLYDVAVEDTGAWDKLKYAISLGLSRIGKS